MKKTKEDFKKAKEDFVKNNRSQCEAVFGKHLEMGDHRRPEAKNLIATARMAIRYSFKTADIDIYTGLMKEWQNQKRSSTASA